MGSGGTTSARGEGCRNVKQGRQCGGIAKEAWALRREWESGAPFVPQSRYQSASNLIAASCTRASPAARIVLPGSAEPPDQSVMIPPAPSTSGIKGATRSDEHTSV